MCFFFEWIIDNKKHRIYLNILEETLSEKNRGQHYDIMAILNIEKRYILYHGVCDKCSTTKKVVEINYIDTTKTTALQ